MTLRPYLPHITALSRLVNDARRTRFHNVLANRRRDICLVLENLGDEHNAGACLRTAECLGIQNIHLVERYQMLHVQDSDACKGAAKWLTIHRHMRASDCASHLHQEGFKIAASFLKPDTPSLLDLLRRNNLTEQKLAKASEEGLPEPSISTEPQKNNTNIDPHLENKGSIALSPRIAFVFGNEGRGVSPYWASNADYSFMLPQTGFTQSLNVSVAAGMTLFAASQLMQPPQPLTTQEQDEVHLRWLLAQIPTAKSVLLAAGLSLDDF
eukprot:TRINITY_DN19331_c0_g1_i1.p1 TRINITY_DN19331_c0_g1~~TRINITY_DN19331_c0_g1_i1.p1  ORF type:complete len:268 (+),score=66.72 TRINITY_DN19331_c0_g1_i1:36-839(+)